MELSKTLMNKRTK